MTRPYPLELDSVPYPPMFKLSTLQTYDGKSSPNQHICYFRSQTSNVIDNDAIMARLFIGTLKGVAFDYFKSLSNSSINLELTWKPGSSLNFMRMTPRWLWTSSSQWSIKEENMFENILRGSATLLLCAPLAFHCPCYSGHVDIISSTEWKFISEVSKPIYGRSLSSKLR